MSVDIQRLRVVIEGDATGATKATADSTAATQAMQAAVTASLQAMQEKIDALVASTVAMATAMQASTAEVGESSEKMESEVKSSTTGAGQAFGRFSTAVQSAIGTFVGNLMIQAAFAVGQFVRQAVSDFSNLQQEVADISTIAPKIDTSQVFASLNEMQTRVPQTATELAREMYDIESSLNLGQADALKLDEVFAKGATGARTGLHDFGASIMGVMNAYHLSVSDATHVSDMFFNTVSAGMLRGPELAASLGPVTQTAKMAGQSIATMFAAIGAGTKEGGNAAENINHISDMFKDLTTAKAQKGFAELGITLTDAGGKFRSLQSIIADYIHATAPLSDASKADALNKIFRNVQSREGFTTVVSQVHEFTKELETNINTSGSAAEAYAKMSATFQTQSTLAKNSISAIATEIGAEVLPKITPLLAMFAKNLPAAMAGIKTYLAPLAQAITSFITGIVTWFQHNFASMKQSAVDAFAPIMPTVNDIIRWFRANFPLIAQTVKTILSTIAEFWFDHAAEIMAVVRPLVDGILTAFKFVMDVINGNWKQAWHDVGRFIRDGLDAVNAAIMGLLSIIGDLAVRLGHAAAGIGTSIWQGIVNGMTPGKSHITAASVELGQAASQGAADALQVHSPSRVMMEIGQNAAQGLANGLAAGTENVRNQAKKAAEAIQAEFRSFDSTLASAKAQLQSLLNGDDADDSKVAAKFRHISEARRDELTTILSRISDLKDEAKAQSDLTDAIEESQKQIKILQATTAVARLAPEYPGASTGDNAGDLQKLATLQQRQSALEAVAEAQKSLTESIEETRRSIRESTAATVEDQIAIDKFGKTFDELTSAQNRYLVSQQAALQIQQQVIENMKKTAVPMGTVLGTGEQLPDATASVMASMYASQGAQVNAAMPGLMASLSGVFAGMNNAGVADMTSGGIGSSRRERAGDGAASKNGQDTIIDQFIDDMTNAAKRSGQQFLETMLGGSRANRAAAMKGLLGDLEKSATSSVSEILSNSFKPAMKQIVSDLQGTINTLLQAVSASTMTILSQIYSLLAISGANGKKQQGGGLLGGIIGLGAALLSGGLLAPVEGLTLGASFGAFAADPSAGTGLSTLAALGGAGLLGSGGSAKSAATGGGKSASVQVNHYGDINNLGGLDQLTGKITDAVNQGLRTIPV